MGVRVLHRLSVVVVATLAAGVCHAVVVRPNLAEPAVVPGPAPAQRPSSGPDGAVRLPAEVERVMSTEAADGPEVLDLLDELQMGAPQEVVAPVVVVPAWTGPAGGGAGVRNDAARRTGDASLELKAADDDPTARAVAWLREQRDWVLAAAAGTLVLVGVVGWMRDRGAGARVETRDSRRRHRRRHRSRHVSHDHHTDHADSALDSGRLGQGEPRGSRSSSGMSGGHGHVHRDGHRRHRRMSRSIGRAARPGAQCS